jgi:Orsellinic acid/F9775 biosynthesis cluster protein D
MERYFLYLEDFHVIVCRICQYGIPKDGVQLHLRRHHKNEIELSVRKELETHVRTLVLWDVSDIQSPAEEVNAIEGLKTHEGFICTVQDCNKLCTTPGSMEKHCQLNHDWVKSKGTRHSE